MDIEGRGITFHHNLVWDASVGCKLQGFQLAAYNNTVLAGDSKSGFIVVFEPEATPEECAGWRVRNNAAYAFNDRLRRATIRANPAAVSCCLSQRKMEPLTTTGWFPQPIKHDGLLIQRVMTFGQSPVVRSTPPEWRLRVLGKTTPEGRLPLGPWKRTGQPGWRLVGMNEQPASPGFACRSIGFGTPPSAPLRFSQGKPDRRYDDQ
ncbi:MAG: hypothetical protein R3C59_12950 [Planctomycetaceae bacterium]